MTGVILPMPCRHDDVIQHMVLSDLATEADVWPWMGRILEFGDPSTRILAAAVSMPSIEYLERGESGTEWLEPSDSTFALHEGTRGGYAARFGAILGGWRGSRKYAESLNGTKTSTPWSVRRAARRISVNAKPRL